MKKQIVIYSFAAGTLLLALSPSAAVAQSLPNHYQRGLELFEAEQYGAAQAEFRKAEEELTLHDPEQEMRIHYYIAISALQTNQTNAEELLEHFAATYPHSIYINDIRFALGKLAQENEYFEAAYSYYQSVSPYDLNRYDSDEYNFRTGYTAFRCDDLDKAYGYLQNCSSTSSYYYLAIYYMAYMDYVRGNLSGAKQGFSSLIDNPIYAPIVPFYLLQIEFQEENYPYVIEHGVPLLEKATESRQQEISRIVSESYYQEKDYANALTYIDMYESLGGTMGREELYLAGFSNHQRLYFTKATSQLSAAASSGNDALSQNAYFHLADCYLQLGDKPKALAAFTLAAGSDYDRGVQEEAMFNQGKLQYELGGGVFNEAIVTLNNYLRLFPDSPRVDETHEILLSAYFNSRNYEAAYESIKNIRNPDNNIKAAMQKIAYFRGLEFFEMGAYTQAESFFRISDANRFNPKYTALTRFWRAEILVRQEAYRDAIPLYKEYITLSPRTEYENQVAHYNLGYCYFNLQQWSESQEWFRKFTSLYKTQDQLLSDTYNRLGDVSFAQREYAQAITYYDRAIQMGSHAADYARFQRSVMLGLNGKRDQKISSLLSIISTGQGDYVDDAMFELGRTYMQADRFTDGASVFKNLINRFPSSPFYLPALAELGLTYQNLNNQKEALRYYKQVVDEFPNSREAKDAMLGIRNIYVDQNDVESYFAYARKSGIETNTGVIERDSLTFAAANRVYQDGNYSKALPLMDKYLAQYPQGNYRTDALYALGDCSLRAGNRQAALAAFDEVGEIPANRYQVLALQKAARMQSEDKNHTAAARLYKQLSTAAVQTSTIAEGLEGYLRSTAALGNLSATADAADVVLASSAATTELKREASFAKAKYLQSQGKNDEALSLYRTTTAGRTVEAAESRFRIAEILSSQSKYKEAEKEVFALADQNTPHTYWMGKAFLLLGDNYAKQGDAFQAKATYQSIVDGYGDKTDGLIDEARERIKRLK